MANILQAGIMTDFVYPMMLVFVIVFAVLEKTKILGDDKKQLNAIVGLVTALIFVGAVFPKLIVANLVQFMTVGLVIIFVGMMLWGFISGNTDGKPFGDAKWAVWIIAVAMFFGVLWATGLGSPLVRGLQDFMSFLFDSSWSGSFWSNVLFIGVIAVGVAVVLMKSGSGTPAGK